MPLVKKRSLQLCRLFRSSPANRARAVQLQEIAIQCLRAKSNINLIDRSADSLLLQELDNQIREQSMASNIHVEQGKVSGAQDIIVGILTSVGVEERNVRGLLSPSTKKYLGNISYSLQIMDASTGVQKTSKTFDGSTKKQDLGTKIFGNTKLGKASSLLMADTKEDAILKAINDTKNEIAEWINEAYPAPVKLLSVDTRDSKGQPDNVAIGGLSSEVRKGKTITVNEITVLDDGSGKQFKRVKKIGELKVLENQGDVTECKVTDGADIIEDKMKDGAKFRIRRKIDLV